MNNSTDKEIIFNIAKVLGIDMSTILNESKDIEGMINEANESEKKLQSDLMKLKMSLYEIKERQRNLSPLVKKQEKQTQEFGKRLRNDFLNNIPAAPGIYLWTNIDDGFKKYVGSAIDIHARATTFLRNDDYAGKRLNEAKSKYPNLSSWTFTILEFCKIEELEDREKFYIQALETYSPEKGYNKGTPSRKDKDIIITKTREDTSIIPSNIISKYDVLRQRYRGLHKDMTVTEFYERVKGLGVDKLLNDKATMSFFLKQYVKKTDRRTPDCLGIMPRTIARLASPKSKISVQERGLLPGLIRLKESGLYRYKFTFNGNTYTEDFSTEETAYNEMIKRKKNLVKSAVEKERHLIDDESYEIFKNMSDKDFEEMFVFKG